MKNVTTKPKTSAAANTGEALVAAESTPVANTSLETTNAETKLTEAEEKELLNLEGVIKKGWSAFLEVGRALVTISEKKLYREQGATFEQYCRQKLGLSRPYAYNLIGSARVNEQMSSIEDIQVKPATESQFRELLSVPEEKRVEAWKEAIKSAGDKPVTAKIVHEAAAPF